MDDEVKPKYKSLAHSARNVLETGFVTGKTDSRNTGHVKSGRNVYSSFDGGHTEAMRRVTDQERESKKELADSEKNKEKEIERRKQLRKEEVDPNRNTEERKKVINVARMNSSNAMSSNSTLSKTDSIKNKIVDEGNSPMFTKNFNLSASLIEATRLVMEKQKEMNDTKHAKAKEMVGGKPNKVIIEPKLDTSTKSVAEAKKSHSNKDIDGEESAEKEEKAETKKVSMMKGVCPKCGKKSCGCSSMKEETELQESMKLVKTHEDGPHHAKVYKDSEYGEYRVKYFNNGKHLPDADSFHDDAEDAHGTAKAELKRMNKTQKEEAEIFSDEELDRISQVLEAQNLNKLPSGPTASGNPNGPQGGYNTSNDVDGAASLSDETEDPLAKRNKKELSRKNVLNKNLPKQIYGKS
jgi:hypothetical protein